MKKNYFRDLMEITPLLAVIGCVSFIVMHFPLVIDLDYDYYELFAIIDMAIVGCIIFPISMLCPLYVIYRFMKWGRP